MCLTKLTSDRYRTSMDITAYKVLDKRGRKLFSEFYDTNIATKFGAKRTARQERIFNTLIKPTLVYVRGFHAFTDRGQATGWKGTPLHPQVVVQVTIPKGAWVQYGITELLNGCELKIIVASEIIFEKKLKR